jgi:hypothetical protein
MPVDRERRCECAHAHSAGPARRFLTPALPDPPNGVCVCWGGGGELRSKGLKSHAPKDKEKRTIMHTRPSHSSPPPLSREKIAECRRAGAAMRVLLEKDLKPRDIMTRKVPHPPPPLPPSPLLWIMAIDRRPGRWGWVRHPAMAWRGWLLSGRLRQAHTLGATAAKRRRILSAFDRRFRSPQIVVRSTDCRPAIAADCRPGGGGGERRAGLFFANEACAGVCHC